MLLLDTASQSSCPRWERAFEMFFWVLEAKWQRASCKSIHSLAPSHIQLPWSKVTSQAVGWDALKGCAEVMSDPHPVLLTLSQQNCRIYDSGRYSPDNLNSVSLVSAC